MAFDRFRYTIYSVTVDYVVTNVDRGQVSTPEHPVEP